MKREARYLVLKIADIERYLTPLQVLEFDELMQQIANGRNAAGKQETKYVVVGHDWPMYEDTWKAIAQWNEDSQHLYGAPVCSDLLTACALALISGGRS